LADRDVAEVISLLIVDDHPVLRHGLRDLILRSGEVTVCGEAANSQEALAAVGLLKPDLATVDVCLPGISGFELIKQMMKARPGMKILMISVHDEPLYAIRAYRAGAKAYLPKQEALETIAEALRTVIWGGIYVSSRFSARPVFKSIEAGDATVAWLVGKLSDRELHVFQLIGHHKSTQEMADGLNLSVKTIETHRAHIEEKLALKSAEALTEFASEWIALTEVSA
jgi:DNA-binding NarL/FixJ family response regulator